MITKSLGDFIVDRTESLDVKLISEYFIDTQHKHIDRLLDSEQYILEGSRGIGKTMLLRTAEIKAFESFSQSSVLAVWVNFEESLRIARIKIIDNTIDPFLQWTMGKILYETLKKIIELKPSCMDELSIRLGGLFGDSNKISSNNSYKEYVHLLEQYINVLEKGDIEDSDKVSKEAPSSALSSILDNPVSFKEFILKMIDDFSLERVVFLFDEAAHVFSHEQQEKFFTLFKNLRNPKIACKAAVYPGITNYGKYFEKGQDAKELRIDWSLKNTEDIDYIKKILKTRILAYDESYWEKLNRNKDIIDTICICSNGNPRFAFHIIDELENIKAFKKSSITFQLLINSVRTAFDNKWKDFASLENRLVKYKSFIKESELFIKKTIITNLKVWNEKRRGKDDKLSIGFFIETSAYDKIPQIFDTLAYHNIVNINYSKKSIGHGLYGFFVNLNPSILFSDGIIKTPNEIASVSIAIENNQAYYLTTPEIVEISNKVYLEKEFKCSNLKCDYSTNNEDFSFCPKCGSKINQTILKSLYNVLRDHDISELRLSDKLKVRLKSKFKNIGELYDADIEDIRMPYIQDARINKIRSAVIEYMAG